MSQSLIGKTMEIHSVDAPIIVGELNTQSFQDSERYIMNGEFLTDINAPAYSHLKFKVLEYDSACMWYTIELMTGDAHDGRQAKLTVEMMHYCSEVK